MAPIFGQTPNMTEVTFTSSDTTTKKTIFTAGSLGAKLTSIACTSSDSANIDLEIYINDGTTDYFVGYGVVPAGAGTVAGGTTSINLIDQDMLPWLDALGHIPLPASYTVKVACNATMTTGTLTVIGIGVDF